MWDTEVNRKAPAVTGAGCRHRSFYPRCWMTRVLKGSYVLEQSEWVECQLAVLVAALFFVAISGNIILRCARRGASRRPLPHQQPPGAEERPPPRLNTHPPAAPRASCGDEVTGQTVLCLLQIAPSWANVLIGRVT